MDFEALSNSRFIRQDIGFGRSWKSNIEPEKEGKMEEIKIPIFSDSDIVKARLEGQAMAERAGFTGSDLSVVSAAISEMARSIAKSTTPGDITISILEESGKVGIVAVAHTFLETKVEELFFVRRLRWYMDECKVSYKPGETILTLKKWVNVWTPSA